MKKTAAIAGKTGQFILGSRRGERINALEGMKLSPRMAAILDGKP